MAVIAIIAQGMMGSGVGRRLHENGARSAPCCRAAALPAPSARGRRGMEAAADEQALLSGADFFLSILPPGEAEPLARQLAPALDGARPQAGLCRLQRGQPANRAPDRRDRRADRRRFCRWRDHRRAAAAGLQPDDLRLGSNGGADRGVARLGDRLARHRRPGRRRLGIEDVLCRDHQGDDRDRCGDAAGGGALRLRRGADRRADREPAGDAGADAVAASRGCTTRPIAGSPRWRKSPIFSKRTRRRATSTPRSPGSTTISRPLTTRRSPAPTTPIKTLDRVLGRAKA